MSRAGAKASKERKAQEAALRKLEEEAAAERRRIAAERRRIAAAVDAALRKLEEDAAADFMLAACERCGLVQVQPPSPDWTAIADINDNALPPAGTVCVMCGNETARFFTSEPSSP